MGLRLMLFYSGFLASSSEEEGKKTTNNEKKKKKAKPFQRDDNSWQCPTPLCLLDHNTELQSNKAGKKRGKYQINQLQISHSESGRTIHTCRGRTSYSVDQGQSALGIS